MDQSLIWTDKTVFPKKRSFSTEIARICPLWVDFALDQGVRVRVYVGLFYPYIYPNPIYTRKSRQTLYIPGGKI